MNLNSKLDDVGDLESYLDGALRPFQEHPSTETWSAGEYDEFIEQVSDSLSSEDEYTEPTDSMVLDHQMNGVIDLMIPHVGNYTVSEDYIVGGPVVALMGGQRDDLKEDETLSENREKFFTGIVTERDQESDSITNAVRRKVYEIVENHARNEEYLQPMFERRQYDRGEPVAFIGVPPEYDSQEVTSALSKADDVFQDLHGLESHIKRSINDF